MKSKIQKLHELFCIHNYNLLQYREIETCIHEGEQLESTYSNFPVTSNQDYLLALQQQATESTMPWVYSNKSLHACTWFQPGATLKQGGGFQIKAYLWFSTLFLTTSKRICSKKEGGPPSFAALARTLMHVTGKMDNFLLKCGQFATETVCLDLLQPPITVKAFIDFNPASVQGSC